MAVNSLALDPDFEPSSTQARSFGGCDTCRSRRVKCDEARPGCSQCRKSGLFCRGYAKSIFFDFEDDNAEERTRFRRPLFTERARRLMSEQLTSSIPSCDLHRHLSQLEEECQSMPLDSDDDVNRGPFGAFRVAKGRLPITPAAESHTSAQSPSRESAGHIEQPEFLETLPADHFTYSTHSDNLIYPDFLTSETDLLPYLDSDFCDTPQLNQLDSTNAVRDDAGRDPPADVTSVASFDKQAAQHDHFPELMTPVSITTQLASSIQIPSSLSTISYIPKHAVFLFQYFSTTVLNFLTPVRHEKTQWHILFLPHVRNYLALMTLGERVDHAGMCAFYGILAISALNLGGVHQSQPWQEQGEMNKRLAAEYCQIMLRGAYDLPKKYKYKSVLMALQIMILLATLSGDPVTEESYFLEAEKFIKLKGLGRKSSRKVRLLHHCYGFERIIYESTCMRGIDFNYRSRVSHDIKSSTVVPYPEDSMAFRLPNWHNLDEEIGRSNSPRDEAIDQEDEVLGLWPDSLYSEASGLPEQWILLFLHVVLLGKEKDAAERNPNSASSLDLDEFLGRAKKLERCIQQMLHHSRPSSVSNPDMSDRESALENMLDAVKQSLQIYLYRRIYEVNPSWLQAKVAKVRDCLLRCETVDPHFEFTGCVGLLWASFIASCEAEDYQVQLSFADWYRRAARTTGMACWRNSLILSEQLWAEKRSKGSKFTWIELLRRHQHQRQQLQACPTAG